MQAALASGRADIAAAQLTATPEWHHVGVAADPYARIPQLVVYQRESARPRGTLQLKRPNSGSSRQPAGAHPRAPAEDGRPDAEVGGDGADKRRPTRGRRLGEMRTTRSSTRGSSRSLITYTRTCRLASSCRRTVPCNGSFAAVLTTCCEASESLLPADARRLAELVRSSRKRPARYGPSPTRSPASSRPTWRTGCRGTAAVRKASRGIGCRLETAGRGRIPGVEVGSRAQSR